MTTDTQAPVVNGITSGSELLASLKQQAASWTSKRARAFSSPTIYAPNLPYECGGAREFNSYLLYALIAGVPYMVKRLLGLSLST
ncbi:hypothetical protein GGF44_004925, partial [Coemansia sp. RSA 1694]